MTDQNIKTSFEDLLKPESEQEQYILKGQVLAMKFLGEIDEAMARQKLKKKELAKLVGTSPSYITQLFRGDRKPNWEMLVKMAEALNIEFHVTTREKYQRSQHIRIPEINGEWVYLNYDHVPKSSYDIKTGNDQFALAV
ncbi:MAG: helix-turn-helix transcriptional regulator [Cyclobacteriaceae bacterium]